MCCIVIRINNRSFNCKYYGVWMIVPKDTGASIDIWIIPPLDQHSFIYVTTIKRKKCIFCKIICDDGLRNKLRNVVDINDTHFVVNIGI